MNQIDKTRPAGRPREFDRDEVLDAALSVFSEHGYEATSISLLSEAMGLTAGSLYKAFGDKRGVFLAAFERYRQVRGALLEARLAGCRTGRQAVEEILRYYADWSHGEDGRRGCMVVGSANDLANLDQEAADRVARAVRENEERILTHIRAGQADGSVRADLDAESLARTLLCLTLGMRVVGRTGPDRDAMAATAAIALKLLD
ncbi:TetR/AcrR family transcriptional regulator [Rhizobium paknamense]|uniref:AcrR family transcriptional regulator n=1 Tax=Rhizobium paknamense TaxID=1206817 RepID=A0ABU0IAY4_9HYPH|nr:TetR/AcrR family transcriptional regulator [Rhizobium paknamense]MDQ0454867.1 AcrR family transcriptional regulator [Rhizobium paknamense]